MSNNGALTQLVAIGAQDSNYLSNDAKDSIFKLLSVFEIFYFISKKDELNNEESIFTKYY